MPKGTPTHTVRIDDALWTTAQTVAAERGGVSRLRKQMGEQVNDDKSVRIVARLDLSQPTYTETVVTTEIVESK